MLTEEHRDRRRLYPWVGVLTGLVLVVAAAWAADFIPGDVNDDGVFDIVDPTVLRRELAGLGPGITQLCGNGTIDGDEDCDFGDLGGATCADEGFLLGTLACGAGCVFDRRGCTDTRFVNNRDGTVSDNQTGLMWEQKTDDGSIHDKDDSYTWSVRFGDTVPDGTAFTTFLSILNGGVTGVGDCESSDRTTITGGFAGHCDWRLPTITELQTIMDLSVPGCGVSPFTTPCIDPIFGPTPSDFYWSATSYAVDPAIAWGVNFKGRLNVVQKHFLTHVRAVRGGDPGPGIGQLCGDGIIDVGEDCDFGDLGGATCADEGFPLGTLACGAGCVFDTSGCSTRFLDNGDGTITDDQTGLMWARRTDDGTVRDKDFFFTWSATGSAPDGTLFVIFLLTMNSSTIGCFAGHCNWRLPTLNELVALVDCDFGSPCIDPILGPAAPSTWSSTENSSNTQLAWGVLFGNGTPAFGPKVNTGGAMAVRDRP